MEDESNPALMTCQPVVVAKTKRNAQNRQPMVDTTEQDQRELARRIDTALRETKMTVAEVADECGVSPQAVSKWRKTGQISRARLTKLATAVGKDLSYFTGDQARSSALPPAVLVTAERIAELPHDLREAISLIVQQVYATTLASKDPVIRYLLTTHPDSPEYHEFEKTLERAQEESRSKDKSNPKT